MKKTYFVLKVHTPKLNRFIIIEYELMKIQKLEYKYILLGIFTLFNRVNKILKKIEYTFSSFVKICANYVKIQARFTI